MKEALKKIKERLEEMYPDLSPEIEMFGDGSWLVEIDYIKNGQKAGRLSGELSGDDIEALESKLEIKI